MAKEIQLTWGKLVAIAGGIMTLSGLASYLFTPHYNESFNKRYNERLTSIDTEKRILEVAEEFIYSPKVKLFLLETQEKYEQDRQLRESEKIKLRSLLASKMECDEDEVHIELGAMYKDWKNNREKWGQN